MPFTLPALSYDFAALEPHIDAKTMEIHHDKHHATYVAKLNTALEATPELAQMEVTELLKKLDTLPENVRTAVKNHGGGHANHTLFWEILTPGGAQEPTGDLAAAITELATDFATFKKTFSEKSLAQFGSGWGWLVVKEGKLVMMTLPNQDSPLSQGLTPILGIDVWEHAYYLKHQSDRAGYLEGIWNVINWDKVTELYNEALH
jgi:Fe-Mn family superoxide dismutase